MTVRSSEVFPLGKGFHFQIFAKGSATVSWLVFITLETPRWSLYPITHQDGISFCAQLEASHLSLAQPKAKYANMKHSISTVG